jgi:hypothetical protein
MSNYTKTEGGSEVDILTDYAKTSYVSSTYATKTYVDGLGVLSTVNLARNVTGILPITKGGTGKTKKEDALAALGGLSSVDLSSNVVTGILPITKGGTGKTTKEDALAALGGLSYPVNLTPLPGALQPIGGGIGILPIANGGTGADNKVDMKKKLLGFYGVKIQFTNNITIGVGDINKISAKNVRFRYMNDYIYSNSIIVATYLCDKENVANNGVTVTLYEQTISYVRVVVNCPDGDLEDNGYIHMIILNLN